MTAPAELTIIYLDPNDIQILNRELAMSEETVNELVACIRAEGFRAPIEVYSETILGQSCWILATGLNRLTAAKKLEMATVPCVVVVPEMARLRELNENFVRRNLTVLEQADLIIALVKESKKHAAQHAQHHETQGGQQPGGRSETARRLNVPRDTLARAEQLVSLNHEARAVARERGLDRNQAALLRAAKETGERQAQCLRIYPAKLGSPSPAPEPNVAPTTATARDLWFTEISRLWKQSKAEWRKTFLRLIVTTMRWPGSQEPSEPENSDFIDADLPEENFPI